MPFFQTFLSVWRTWTASRPRFSCRPASVWLHFVRYESESMTTLVQNPQKACRPLTEEATRRLLAAKSELPASFEVLDQALQLMRKPECTNDRLQDVLMRDPASVADVTRLANSAYFGVPGRIRTAATAVRVVGHRRLETLLRHLMVGKLFELLKAENPAADAVHDAALGAAAAAGVLSRTWAVEDSDSLRLVGLIHNLGELALISGAPELYVKARKDLGQGRLDGDIRYFGISFPEATATLLRLWRFPTDHVEAVQRHRTLEGTHPTPACAMTLGLHVAAGLSFAWAAHQTPDSARRGLSVQALEGLKLSEEQIFGCYAAIPVETERLRSWLGR